MMCWKDRRIVNVARSQQLVEHPCVFVGEREASRSVTKNTVPGYIFQLVLRPRRIFIELFRSQVISEPMCPTMRRNFMTSLHRFLHEMWEALPDPAQKETSAMGIVIGRNVEKPNK